MTKKSSAKKPAGKQKQGKKTGFRGPSPDVGKATQIKPGERRNPSGKNQYTPISDMYREIFADAKNLQRIKASTLKILLSGRMAAVLLQKEAAERLEGKVKQEVEATVTVSIRSKLEAAMKRALE